MKRVLVAMSGGVDSSTTAVILKSQGYDVIGITMKLFSEDDRGINRKQCCTIKDSFDAKDVAYKNNFFHYTSNMTEEFKRYVIDNFVDEYYRGRTPNPCIMCNRYLKFDLLWRRAKELGCDHLATGHYAKVIRENGKHFIARARDKSKDQSYFLFNTPPEVLPHLLFPVGELTKDEVRELASSHGLSCARKEESQDICFVRDNDYRAFLESFPHERKSMGGNVIDRDGNILGKHQGFFNFTVGQRRGLGLNYHKMLYVLRINPDTNEVVVGEKEDLAVSEFKTGNPTIFDKIYFDGKTRLDIQTHYRSKPVSGTIKLENDTLLIKLEKPASGVTPGQAMVAFLDDKVVGGGWIDN